MVFYCRVESSDESMDESITDRLFGIRLRRGGAYAFEEEPLGNAN